MNARFDQTLEFEIVRHVSAAFSKSRPTLAKGKWGMKLFRDWSSAWHDKCDGLEVVVDAEEMTASDVDNCVSFFVLICAQSR